MPPKFSSTAPPSSLSKKDARSTIDPLHLQERAAREFAGLGSPIAPNNKGTLVPTVWFSEREPKKIKGKRVLLRDLELGGGLF